MHSLLSSVVTLIQTDYRSLPGRIFRKLLNKLGRVSSVTIYRFDIHHGNLPKISKTNTLSILKIFNETSVIFRTLVENFPGKKFSSRLEFAGSQCIVAYVNDRIVSYAWVAVDNCYIAEIDYQFKLEFDEIFIYDCFVEKNYRGRGIYPSIIAEILATTIDNISSQNMVNYVYIGAEASNTASNKGIKKVGFKEYSRVFYLQFLKYTHRSWKKVSDGSHENSRR